MQVVVGLAEIVGGIGMTVVSCGGAVVPGVISIGVGLDTVMTGAAGLIDGESYGSAIGYASSQAMQSVGVPANVADVVGELVPIALTLGSSAFAKACFAAGTQLRTPGGLRAIEEFAVGDLVLSRDEFDPSGPVEAKRVEEVFRNLAPVWHLHLGEAIIRTSGEHPFYARGLGWTAARELKIGDLVAAEAGWVEVTDLLDTGEWEPVFNVRVSEHHTYFVGDEGWGFAVWAHNACALPILGRPPHGGALHNSTIIGEALIAALSTGVTGVRTNQALVNTAGRTLSRLRPDVQYIKDGLIHIIEVNVSGGSGYHRARITDFRSILGSLFGSYTPL